MSLYITNLDHILRSHRDVVGGQDDYIVNDEPQAACHPQSGRNISYDDEYYDDYNDNNPQQDRCYSQRFTSNNHGKIMTRNNTTRTMVVGDSHHGYRQGSSRRQQSDLEKNNKTCIKCAALSCVIILFLIAGGIVAFFYFDRDDGIVITEGEGVPPPHYELHLICSPRNRTHSSKDELSKCHLECLPGECCYDSSSSSSSQGNNNCRELYSDNCAGYTPHCDHIYLLQDDIDKGEGPPVLNVPDEILTDSRDNDDDDDDDDDLPTVVAIPNPPSNIDQICSSMSLSQREGLYDCASYCSNAACCFSDSLNMISMLGAATLSDMIGCRMDNEMVCTKYDSCRNLEEVDLAPFNVPADPPLDIGVTCSSSSVAKSFGACLKICLDAACCFFDSDAILSMLDSSSLAGIDDCYSEYNETCTAYEPCRKLENILSGGGSSIGSDSDTMIQNTASKIRPNQEDKISTGVVPNPPSNLGDICSKRNLDESWGKNECLRSCRDAVCCFPESLAMFSMLDKSLSGVKDCRNNNNEKNEGVCLQYQPCMNLEIIVEALLSAEVDKALQLTTPQAPQDISNVCSPQNLKTTEGFLDCEMLCYPGVCCAEESDKIKEETTAVARTTTNYCDVDNCKNYAPCQILSTTGGDPVTDCADLTTSEGFRRCERACKPAMCCFMDEPDENCVTDLTEGWCDLYEDCLEIVERLVRYEEGGTSDDVNEFCTSDSIKTEEGKIKCEEACTVRSCCFVQESWSCLEEDKEWCNEFSACQILSGDYKEEIPVPQDISNVCSPQSLKTTKGFLGCETLCYPGVCCAEERDKIEEETTAVARTTKDSCDVNSCKNYAPCQILSTGGDPKTDCADLTTSEGLEQCERVCKPAMCCFMDGPENCVTNLTEVWCHKFDHCLEVVEKLIRHEKGGNSDSVNEFCTSDSIKTEEGKRKCEEACMVRSCCFVQESWSCLEEDKEWCNEFSACQILASAVPRIGYR